MLKCKPIVEFMCVDADAQLALSSCIVGPRSWLLAVMILLDLSKKGGKFDPIPVSFFSI